MQMVCPNICPLHISFSCVAQPVENGLGATLSNSQEQQLSEKLQQIRLHLVDLREAVHRSSGSLGAEATQSMHGSILGAIKMAGEAKEVAEILKVKKLSLKSQAATDHAYVLA